MASFERAFEDMEEAAASTLKSATDLAKLARALQKAAQDGNVNTIKRTCARLGPALGSLRQEVANVTKTWPFTDEEEENYLKERYANELCDTAREKKIEHPGKRWQVDFLSVHSSDSAWGPSCQNRQKEGIDFKTVPLGRVSD